MCRVQLNVSSINSARWSSNISECSGRQDDRYIEAKSRHWAKEWVQKLNLCPWVGGVLVSNKLKVSVRRHMAATDSVDLSDNGVNEEDNHQLLTDVLCDIVEFVESSKKLGTGNSASSVPVPETAFIVLPDLSNDFGDFLRLVDQLQEVCDKTGLSEVVQIATFHPQYVFEDSDHEESVENYTNRSPYGILHLLRVAHVGEMIDRFDGDTNDIWRRNVELMKKMGLKKVRCIHREINANNSV